MMVSIIFSLSIALTGMLIVKEKNAGLFDRSLVAGVTTVEFVLASLALRLLIMICQVVLIIVISNLVFKVRYIVQLYIFNLFILTNHFTFQISVEGPMLIFAAMLILQGFCGMSFGITVSLFARSEQEVLEISIAVIYPVWLLSGNQ